MFKKLLLATIAIFVAWEILDFVIHGVILQSTYASQPELWRSQEDMKMGLMVFVVLVSALCFAYLYGAFVGNKSLATAVKFSLIFGIGTGIGMGYGTYSVQPIPYHMALVWFLGSVVECLVAGVLVGLIIKE
ncbi:MAG: hypothetical protein D6748_15250 [Calditrichaeota bacterium]|nr:MAG: hypothetical protein D6748_15250 [Calditrichota bacterium]